MHAAAYERLSGLDHSFLHFETPTTYMHVALTAVFEKGPLGGPSDGIDMGRIRLHVESRLPLIPRYRQRLHYVPLTNDPVWVDDERFDLGYHLRHSHLPRPGSDAQLRTLCARILERPLDRRRPLWEIWFIEGLEGGRFAMLSKVHHCMVDGIAGMGLLAALLGSSATEKLERPDSCWVPAAAPSDGRLLRDEIRRRGAASLGLVQKVPELLGERLRSDLAARLGSLWGLVRASVRGTARTPFNRPIGPHRRLEWLSFDLAEAKEIKRRLGGTLNDVVLGIVTGAMRHFLEPHVREMGNDEFRALVPVSTRRVDAARANGNRVSAWITALPVDEPRPLERFRQITELTSCYRSRQEERGVEVLTGTAEWATAIGLGLATRLIGRTRPFNLIVTNVPGPPVPFYLLGAPMLAAYPHVPLFENQGLGIAILSYSGRLYFGLVGDWDLMPDLARVAAATALAFAELCEAAGLKRSELRPRRGPRPRVAHAVA
jgi:diacylglycerol O-acyltransferase